MDQVEYIEQELAQIKTKSKADSFVRFVSRQRIEHLILMITFVALAVTGLAEKYYTAGWADWLIMNMGGIAMTRLIHRAFGLIFTISLLYHFVFLIFTLGFQNQKASMLPNMNDIRHIMDSLRYTFGFRERPILYGRYDYRQKFEYWGIIFGGTIMTLTGIVLVFPTAVTTILPGQFVAAAREAHGNEAMLAVLTIIVWHLYDVIFKPSIFPADLSIFTGKISKKRMLEEHAGEYYEITRNKQTAEKAKE